MRERNVIASYSIHYTKLYEHAVDTSGLKGSGLGLAISKQIALLLRGDLLIVSEGEGKGATATFQFRSF